MNTDLTKGFVDFIDDNRLQSLIHDTKEDPAVYREILKNRPGAQALGLRQPYCALRPPLHRQLLHQ